MAYTRLNPDSASVSGTISNVSGVANTSTYSYVRYGKVVTVNVAVTLSADMASWQNKTLLSNMPKAAKAASTLIAVDSQTSQAKLNANTDGTITLASRGGALTNGRVLNGSIVYICT